MNKDSSSVFQATPENIVIDTIDDGEASVGTLVQFLQKITLFHKVTTGIAILMLPLLFYWLYFIMLSPILNAILFLGTGIFWWQAKTKAPIPEIAGTSWKTCTRTLTILFCVRLIFVASVIYSIATFKPGHMGFDGIIVYAMAGVFATFDLYLLLPASWYTFSKLTNTLSTKTSQK